MTKKIVLCRNFEGAKTNEQINCNVGKDELYKISEFIIHPKCPKQHFEQSVLSCIIPAQGSFILPGKIFRSYGDNFTYVLLHEALEMGPLISFSLELKSKTEFQFDIYLKGFKITNLSQGNYYA